MINNPFENENDLSMSILLTTKFALLYVLCKCDSSPSQKFHTYMKFLNVYLPLGALSHFHRTYSNANLVVNSMTVHPCGYAGQRVNLMVGRTLYLFSKFNSEKILISSNKNFLILKKLLDFLTSIRRVVKLRHSAPCRKHNEQQRSPHCIFYTTSLQY